MNGIQVLVELIDADRTSSSDELVDRFIINITSLERTSGLFIGIFGLAEFNAVIEVICSFADCLLPLPNSTSSPLQTLAEASSSPAKPETATAVSSPEFTLWPVIPTVVLTFIVVIAITISVCVCALRRRKVRMSLEPVRYRKRGKETHTVMTDEGTIDTEVSSYIKFSN